MDIESDDSERWEDFFGSSTELAPSLLGIYDTLTTALDVSHGGDQCTTSTSNNAGRYNGNPNTQHSSPANTSNSSSCTSRSEESTECHGDSRLDLNISDGNDQADSHCEEDICQRVLELPLQQSILCVDVDSSTGSSSNKRRSLTLTRGKRLTCQSLSTLSLTNTSSNSSHNSTNSQPSGGSTSNLSKSRESSLSASSINKHRNNIRVLSANVQRIITHSDAEPVDTVDIDALQTPQQQQQQQQYLSQSPVPSPVPQHRYVKKSPQSLTHGHKVKLSHIPLSKTTGKLSQAGSDLVETFDSSSEYLDALGFSATAVATEKKSWAPNKPPTPAIIKIPGVDDQKTPTNTGSPFTFDYGPNQLRKLTLPKTDAVESIKLIEMEKLGSMGTQLLSTSTPVGGRIAKEFIATEPLSPCEIVEAINYSLVSKNMTELKIDDDIQIARSNGELIEAINKPLISKPLVRSSSAVSASPASGSPLLTYARHMHAAKANTLGGPVPLKLPTAEQLEELEEASKMSAESLDRLTDIKSKFSPKESRKISGLMLPEIAKLKHRPLSSSSICSTSSSSSSGSDQLNGKLATSYLASVESLADQSENELMDPHSGMSVFERSCMEIVDSERSFVQDLGQVIRGYLFDWKERACLSYDELRILFSNIEEIYDFNSTLLKQLINSGMDPGKIAKCFIDLRERFDVYTTYCTSYPEAISLLTKLLQATHTNALLTSTQKMLQHTLPLGSYLLKPVQRILKYHLLLDNLRKHCDVKEVFQAYEIMRQVARNIDQVKRKLEQQSRVKELSGILDGWLGPELTVLGELRLEGLLMEHNKPRIVFLFGTMLIITKSKEDNRLQFKSYIHQNNLMLSEHLPGEPTSFYVIPYDEPRSQIKLTAKNRDQKRLWAQHIKGVILEKFDNIPNRAKELVYKLGDEEDRTPDKHTWKWSLHSASTPTYLERRNQYRRSEIRNRSKFKRKTVTNSSSFDSFNEATEVTNELLNSGVTSLSRNNSMDDNMLPALQKLAAAAKSKGRPESSSIEGNTKGQFTAKEDGCSCPDNKEKCVCILRDRRKLPKSPLFGGKALKERSKSVPRISFQCEDLDDERTSLHGTNTNLDSRKSKSSKSIEIKQYNHKTIPKRIATLKKQRSSKKETSKFYMDLTEFEESPQTVLRITESTENLFEREKAEVAEEAKDPADTSSGNLPDNADSNADCDGYSEETNDCTLSPSEKARKDAQIILDLLKNNKEFEKLCRKPQKKRLENVISAPTSPEPQDCKLGGIRALPPRPPSRSPPPLESETESSVKIEEEEPIYESLLRNVHVPYKFSPILSRSVSAQPYKAREKKSISVPRPESDYVTLIYSAEGALKQVGDDIVERGNREPQLRRPNGDDEAQAQRDSSSSTSSSSTLKRDSQNTVINVEYLSSGNVSQISYSTSTTEAIYSRPIPKNLMKRLLSVNSSKSAQENVCNSETSLVPRARKSIENIALSFGRCNKPPERRVSDVSEMCRQSILHRQGSEAVGERMAHVDYADPRTLFAVATSEASLQRDSVFSLTSSNDSVCDHKRAILTSVELSTNFEYEDNVEACLENDFRDSAIYSDDNEKRPDSEVVDYSKRPRSPPPPPPLSARPKHSLPQMVPKPKLVREPLVLAAGETILAHNGSTAVIICPPHLSAAASRSWVLQQIENFNK